MKAQAYAAQANKKWVVFLLKVRYQKEHPEGGLVARLLPTAVD